MRLKTPRAKISSGPKVVEGASSRFSLHSRVVLLLSVYVVVSAGLLAAHLWQLYRDTLVAGEKLVTAFAQVTDEQTSRTLQNVDQTLQFVNARLSVAGQPLPGPDQMREELGDLLKSRPFLKGLFVLDESGDVVYEASTGNIGTDMSDRPYFFGRRAPPGANFTIDAPVQSRFMNGWIIPASRAWLRPDGKPAGVIVAAMDPHFFDRVWTVNEDSPDFAIALFRDEGRLLLRSPFDEKAMGRIVSASSVFDQLRLGRSAGLYQSESIIDGKSRVLAFRRLSAYPHLVLVVGESKIRLLASWRRTARILVAGWIVAAAVAGLLALWLVREWEARRGIEQQYRLLFEANPHAVAVIDRQTGRLIKVNEASIKQYGWSQEEHQAMTVDDFYPPDDKLPKTSLRRADWPETPEIFSSLRHLKKDGTIIDVELSTRPIVFDGRPAILAISKDVTARVRAERERQAAEEQLRQAQKMEAVGQLTGGIAHDFNNILNIILANVEAFEEAESLDPELAGRADRIGQAVQRASDLVRQLLAFSRKQPLRPRPTDMNELVGGIGSLLRRALGEHIEIDAVLAEDLWTVNVDRSQLETTLVNLCINARDAMPGGGRLLIETSNAVIDEDYVLQNTDAVAGDYALIAVSDTGGGMPPDVLEKVFEPFFTTKPAGKGTGLGLSMVYGFIKQSQGHIKIYSELGRGTTVKLYLPRSTVALDGQGAARQREALPHGSERILVVEDDPQVRAAVVTQLESLGYDVSQATDGVAGVAVFEAAAQPFDLLLTDVIMPGAMNGRLLANEVARRWPSTKIVFMSGYTENAIVHNGQLDAGVLLLKKPFRKAEMAVMIRRALEEQDGLIRPMASSS